MNWFRAKRNSYKSFQTLRDQLAQIKVQNAVIDGELVCLDDEGRSIFNVLLHRRGHPTFYAFDLLYLDGRDLRQLPLVERKRQLKQLLAGSNLPDVICGKYISGRGVALFNEVCQRNLEGVVAKRKNGTYATISGWLKLRIPATHNPRAPRTVRVVSVTRSVGLNCLFRESHRDGLDLYTSGLARRASSLLAEINESVCPSVNAVRRCVLR